MRSTLSIESFVLLVKRHRNIALQTDSSIMAKLTGGGRYVKGVVVGKGTFGVVFKAYDTHVSAKCNGIHQVN